MPIELVSESPKVGIGPGENRERSRPDPNVDESVWVGVWDARVSSVCISKVLLH